MTQIITVFIAASLVLGLLYVLWKPRWAIVLLLLMFPLEQLLTAYSPAFAARSWVLNVVMGGVGLMAFASACVRPGSRVREVLNPASLAIFALYLVAAVGLLWTPARMDAMGYMKQGLPYYAVFLILVPALLDDLDDYRRILFPLMIGGAAIAVLILIHPRTYFYAGRLFLPVGGSFAEGGGNPLELGRLGGNVAIIAMLIRPQRTASLVAFLRAGAFIVGFGLAIGSGSRGQVIAAMAVGVAFLPLARQLNDPKRFVLAAIGAGVILVGFYVGFKMFVGSSNQARWSLGLMVDDLWNRFDFSWSLISAYLQSPGSWLFGLGPNAFSVVSQYGSSFYVHNLVVEVFCEEGLVGFALLVFACYFAATRGLHVWRAQAHEPMYRAAAATLLALMAYNLLLALKQSSFLASPTFFMYLLILAKVAIGELGMIAGGQIVPAEAMDEDAEDEEADEDYDYGTGDVQPSI